MKVCNVVREDFYQVLAHVFDAMAVCPSVLEVGVLHGQNALKMQRALRPASLVLVDSWSAADNAARTPFDITPSWVQGTESAQAYYGGPLSEQATFDRLFESCRRSFEGQPGVHFVRADSVAALPLIPRVSGTSRFELVYLDANHQYEFVLRDLMLYQDLVSPEGCFVLNDCCHSDAGLRQNLGVLEAASNFIKRSDFVPVALTNTDWSDLILVRRGSLLQQSIDRAVVNSNVAWAEVPAALLPAARVVQGPQRMNISFA